MTNNNNKERKNVNIKPIKINSRIDEIYMYDNSIVCHVKIILYD